MGDNDTVTSATLLLWRYGAPNGTVHIDIFDDSGLGTPNVPVGRLGSIDPMSVELQTPTNYTFDSPVSGLMPNEQYYVVFSQEGGTNWVPSPTIIGSQAIWWSGIDKSDGAGGAWSPLVIQPPEVVEWVPLHADSNLPSGGPPFDIWFHARPRQQ